MNIANRFPDKKHPIGCVLAFFEGDPPAPTSSESMDSIMKAQIANLPALSQVTAANILPMEQAIANAYQQINPQLAQTNLDVYKQYAPQANTVGQEMARSNALAQAATEADVLKGAGRDVTLAALENAKLADPEYYKTREVAANQMQALLNSYDPNKLSGSTAAETERQLNRMSGSMGTSNTQDGTTAAVNALGFGSALNQQRSGLAQALSQVPGNLQGFKSGVDVMQQGVGRSSQSQFGGNIAPVANQSNMGSATNNMSNNMFQSGTQLQSQANQLNSQRLSGIEKANNAMTGVIGACCFIFISYYDGVLPWYVRKCRDMYAEDNSDARKGYIWMSKWLVPLMEKSAYVRDLVGYFMIQPLTRNGAWMCGEFVKYGERDHRIFRNWMKVWSFLGRMVK